MDPAPSPSAAPSSSTSRSRASARFWLRSAGFLLGLAALLGLLVAFDRLGDVAIAGDKLAWFRAHKDDYDTLFVGSSLIHRQVSPREYDAELAARGLSSRTFNFGVLGMMPPESYFLLEKVLSTRPANLRWVYLELSGFQAQVKREHTRRFDYWHTPRYTFDVLRAVAGSDWGRRARIDQAGRHVEAMLRNLLHVGQGRALLESVGREFDPAVLGPDGDGWLSTEDDKTSRMELRRTELEDFDEEGLEGRVNALRGSGSAGRHESEVGLEILARTLARVRAAGATPILLIPPRLERLSALLESVRVKLDVEVWTFNDPDRYPELYLPEHRFDTQHLNKQGAAVFSRALAARFAESRGR